MPVTALPVGDASGVGSAAGAVVHVTFSAQVCEATRYSVPATGDGFVTYRRRLAAATTSVPTPATVNRSNVCSTGALSAVNDVVVA